MENSVNTIGKAPPANTSRSSSSYDPSANARRPSSYESRPEESSWTMYLDDFMPHDNSFNSDYHEHSSFSSCRESSSLISDAGSLVANKKLAAKDNVHEILGRTGGRDCCSRPNFKKRKTKNTPAEHVVHDDALEDTATSPVNSPKVSYLLFIFYFFYTLFLIVLYIFFILTSFFCLYTCFTLVSILLLISAPLSSSKV